MLAVSLSAHIAFRKPVCEHIHLDGYNQLWGYVDAVPNEETAKKLADIIIEAQSGFIPDIVYDYDISFNVGNNTWVVKYRPLHPDESMLFWDGERHISIRKDSGMVIGGIGFGGR
jgi:hypothetical protein